MTDDISQLTTEEGTWRFGDKPKDYSTPPEPNVKGGWSLDAMVQQVDRLLRGLPGKWVPMSALVRAVYGEDHDEMSDEHWQVRRAVLRLQRPGDFRLGERQHESRGLGEPLRPVVEVRLGDWEVHGAVRWVG